jgi:hypothetical protein
MAKLGWTASRRRRDGRNPGSSRSLLRAGSSSGWRGTSSNDASSRMAEWTRISGRLPKPGTWNRTRNAGSLENTGLFRVFHVSYEEQGEWRNVICPVSRRWAERRNKWCSSLSHNGLQLGLPRGAAVSGLHHHTKPHAIWLVGVKFDLFGDLAVRIGRKLDALQLTNSEYDASARLGPLFGAVGVQEASARGGVHPRYSRPGPRPAAVGQPFVGRQWFG